jgi:BASS family bile acid:Na+ symporter
MNGQFVQLALKVSLSFTVFALALNSRPGQARYLLRHRRLLARSLVAMHVVMPVIALLITSIIPVHPAVRLALVAMMISPIPAALPSKALGAGGKAAYAVSLLMTVSILSVVVVPVTVAVIGKVYGTSMHVPPRVVASVVFSGVVIPLTIGLALVHAAPEFAARLATPVATAANVVLIAALIPLLVTMWPAIRELIGNGTLVVVAALLGIAMLLGYLLGGPRRDERSVLGLAAASRHPGVAIAITTATFPSEQLAPAAVLLTALLGALLSKPYLRTSGRST